jgi:hypothetical protein
MDGRIRDMCKIEAEELDVEIDDSGGVYIPDSRNDLMFDMRRSEDAEGESRIIGSGRRAEAFGFITRDGLFARFVAAGCCDFLAVNGAAILRTCEKS